MDGSLPDDEARFAQYVATLGRGPGRSRALTRTEAHDAFMLVLAERVHPAQLGAFLMLLRYRGEDPDEITGLVEAARECCGFVRDAPVLGPVDLDWPSYGAGRTRSAPWFLLAALAVSQAGYRVLMHGSNAFSGSLSVADALNLLGRPAVATDEAARAELDRSGFAYWPAADCAPQIDRLLGLRRLFGLRSPVNTVARLLDPGRAGASVSGVFHPAYIALHLGVAERLGRGTALVLKGGGGEAERAPAKATTVHLWRDGARSELLLPAMAPTVRDLPHDGAACFVRLWQGEPEPGDQGPLQTVLGTIGMALLALHAELTPEQADLRARDIWSMRRPAGNH